MKQSRIASRYAVSLLRLAGEKGLSARIHQDMEFLGNAVESSRELERMFRSPLIKPEAKTRIVQQLFGATFDSVSMGFLELAIRKHRESEVGGMAKAYVRLYEQQQGTVRVQIQSASEMDASSRSVLEQKLQKALGQGVLLTYKVDPALLGGYVLQSGDLRVDASLQRELRSLRRQFSENPYLPKI